MKEMVQKEQQLMMEDCGQMKKYREGEIDHKNNIIQIIGNIDKNYKNGQNV